MNPKGLWLFNSEYFEGACAAWEGFNAPDPEAFQAFITQQSRRDPDEPRFLKADGVARIPIIGALTKSPDFFFSLFGSGNTVYGNIVAAVQAADADPEIDRIVLEIDSPGGTLAGMFEAAAAIAATTKPTTAEITDQAASAAFALASQADSITVNNPMARVGSIGIVTSQIVNESKVTITSTDAPLKSPDVSTPEGVAAIRAELDAVHIEFAQLIATGRGVTLNQVNTDFGRGGMLIASEALQAGLIDGIDSGRIAAQAEPSSTETTTAMDLNELLAKYPELCASIRQTGHAAGITQERERVTAHVSMGEGSPASALLAAGFIIDGSDFGPVQQAKYLGAARNAADINAVQADSNENSPPGAPPNNGAPGVVDIDAQQSAMFDRIAADRGIELRS